MTSLALNASEVFKIISAEHDSTVPKWSCWERISFLFSSPKYCKTPVQKCPFFHPVCSPILLLTCSSDILPTDTFTRCFQAWSTTMCTLNEFICMVLPALCTAPLCIFIRAEVRTTRGAFGSRWKTHNLLIFLYSFSQMTSHLHLFSQTASSFYNLS